MLPMKEEDCERYERATRCGNCDKLFTPKITKFITIATLPETSHSYYTQKPTYSYSIDYASPH